MQNFLSYGLKFPLYPLILHNVKVSVLLLTFEILLFCMHSAVAFSSFLGKFTIQNSKILQLPRHLPTIHFRLISHINLSQYHVSFIISFILSAS